MPPLVPGQPRLRATAAALLWLLALALVTVVVAGQRRPLQVEHAVAAIVGILAWLCLMTALLGSVALVAWPPTLPWLRVRYRQIRDQLAVDPTAFREATLRLQHLETAPDMITAGRYLARTGQPRRAAENLQRAAELEPDNLGTRLLLGRTLLDAGQATAAAEHLRVLVDRDAGYALGEGLVLLGRALAASGDPAGADAVLARHDREIGAIREVDLLRAQVAARTGDRPRARHYARRAAAPPADARPLRPDEALHRARARVLGWRLGPGSSTSEDRT